MRDGRKAVQIRAREREREDLDGEKEGQGQEEEVRRRVKPALHKRWHPECCLLFFVRDLLLSCRGLGQQRADIDVRVGRINNCVDPL